MPSRIDLITALEDLKSVAEGTQAVLSAAFETSQRAAAAAAGVPAERQGRGVALQIALARRESHHRGRRHLALAKVLRDELPHTLDALRTGKTTEWRATLMARETTCLTREDRQEIDLRIAGDPDRFEQMGDRDVQDAARALACELDPASVAERRRRAEADRHTTLRPAPDTMTFLTALLPVKDGVAVHEALLDEATRLRAAGDPRSRGAIMADTLVRRVLAPHVTLDGTPADVPLVIHVVVPDSVLLGNTNGVGWVEEHGDVPGDLLREWIAAHAENGTQALGQTPLRHTQDRVTRRDGQEGPSLRRRPRRVPPTTRPTMRHPLLRSTRQTPRPHRTPRRRRTHQRDQRPRTLRGLQLRQTSPGLESQPATRTHPRCRDHHTDGTPLQLDHRHLEPAAGTGG